jgi:hypothetical protein
MNTGDQGTGLAELQAGTGWPWILDATLDRAILCWRRTFGMETIAKTRES